MYTLGVREQHKYNFSFLVCGRNDKSISRVGLEEKLALDFEWLIEVQGIGQFISEPSLCDDSRCNFEVITSIEQDDSVKLVDALPIRLKTAVINLLPPRGGPRSFSIDGGI